MARNIYAKLAVTNLKNNRKTYMPYILTAMLMVMMFYMFDALTKSKDLRMETLRLCLQYATGVMVIFSVIFLFYTNSFLMKQRKNEIGVYNVLGMGKRHIAKNDGSRDGDHCRSQHDRRIDPWNYIRKNDVSDPA